jgi:hypothetical protein
MERQREKRNSVQELVPTERQSEKRNTLLCEI